MKDPRVKRRLVLATTVFLLASVAAIVIGVVFSKSKDSSLRGNTTSTGASIDPSPSTTVTAPSTADESSQDLQPSNLPAASPGSVPLAPAVNSQMPVVIVPSMCSTASVDPTVPNFYLGSSACCDTCASALLTSTTCTATTVSYKIQCCQAGETGTACSGSVFTSTTTSLATLAVDNDGSTNALCSNPLTMAPATCTQPQIVVPVTVKAIQPAFGPPRSLLWSDEFDGPALNLDIWTNTIGNGAPNVGFGNRELQSYELANSYVENGQLILEARLETPALPNGNQISSAKIHTYADAYNILYGRVEVKMTIPTGRGAWPSIFFLPVDSEYGEWPGSGEIDLMESYNDEYTDARRIMSSLHFGWPSYILDPANPQPGEGAKGQSACVFIDGTSFAGSPRLFTLEWTPESMKFYLDDKCICEITKWFAGRAPGSTTAPYDKKFNMIINLAFGGDLPGTLSVSDIPDGVLPAKLVVDYVRVFDLTDEEKVAKDVFPGPIIPLADGEKDDTPCKYGKNPSDAWQFGPGLLRIDTEFFDCNGQGVSYFDNTPDTNDGNSALRSHDAVDIWEDEIWIPLGAWKFADCAGSYVLYEPNEWTTYSLNIPVTLYQIYFEMRHNIIGGGNFKILVDSTDCSTTDISKIIVDGYASSSFTPAADKQPPPWVGINIMRCWQAERYTGAAAFWAARQGAGIAGLHTFTLCSMSNLAVQYFEVASFEPSWELKTGPGCGW